jgi:hypothetical protein
MASLRAPSRGGELSDSTPALSEKVTLLNGMRLNRPSGKHYSKRNNTQGQGYPYQAACIQRQPIS